MKKCIVQVECCRDCPYVDFDNQQEPSKWGKLWCTILDKEVNGVDDFPDQCPLDDM